MGDEDFFTALRILVYGRADPLPGNFQPQFGTTQGFLDIVNEVTGDDYGWFFQAYLYQAALPELVEARDGDRVTFRWVVADDLPFPMPLDVKVGDRVVTLPMTDKVGSVEADPLTHVLADPYSKILMQSDAIDRYQAYRAAQAGAD